MKKSDMVKNLISEMSERGYFFDEPMAEVVLDICESYNMKPPQYYKEETKELWDEYYDERYHTIGFYQNGWESED